MKAPNTSYNKEQTVELIENMTDETMSRYNKPQYQKMSEIKEKINNEDYSLFSIQIEETSDYVYEVRDSNGVTISAENGEAYIIALTDIYNKDKKHNTPEKELEVLIGGGEGFDMEKEESKARNEDIIDSTIEVLKTAGENLDNVFMSDSRKKNMALTNLGIKDVGFNLDLIKNNRGRNAVFSSITNEEELVIKEDIEKKMRREYSIHSNSGTLKEYKKLLNELGVIKQFKEYGIKLFW